MLYFFKCLSKSFVLFSCHLQQILSRVKPAIGGETPVTKKIKGKGSSLVEDYLNQRDYVGAMTLLEVCFVI